MVPPEQAADMGADMARRLLSAEALPPEQAADMGANMARRLLSAEAVPPASWSERTNLQVQKMEQTIEQDLSKAMAGLREQFRDSSIISGPRDLSGHVLACSATFPSDEVDGQTSIEGSRSTGSDRGLAGEGILTTAAVESHSSAAVMAEFRSEAAAARDEVLGGLAHLRRDLEAERARQSMQPALPSAHHTAGPGLVEHERYQLQAAASDIAISELRQDMMTQQSAVMEMRRDLMTWQERYHQGMTAVDKTLALFHKELEDVRSMKQPVPPIAEANIGEGLLEDIKMLAGRCEGLEQFTRDVATATAAKLEAFEGKLASDLVEERTAITRGLGVVNEMEKRTQGLVVALEAASTKHADEMKGVRAMCEELMHDQASGLAEVAGVEGKLRADIRTELDTLRVDLAILADKFAAERAQRVQVDKKLAVGAATDGLEAAEVEAGECAAGTGSSLAIEPVRAQLIEEVTRQVKDAGVALRGQLAVGCAELRGEMTARLDAYEEELKLLRAESSLATSSTSQEQLAGRIDATESKLQEVFRVTQMLAAGYRGHTPRVSAGVASDSALSQLTNELVNELAAREAQEAAVASVEAVATSAERSQTASYVESVAPESVLPLISGELKDSLERLVAKVKDMSNPSAMMGEDSSLPLGASNELVPLLAETTHSAQAPVTRSAVFQVALAGSPQRMRSQPKNLTMAEASGQTSPRASVSNTVPQAPAMQQVLKQASNDASASVGNLQHGIGSFGKLAAYSAAGSTAAPVGAYSAAGSTAAPVGAYSAAGSTAAPIGRGRSPVVQAAGPAVVTGSTTPGLTSSGLQATRPGSGVFAHPATSPIPMNRTLSPVIHRSKLPVAVALETVSQQRTNTPPRAVRQSPMMEPMKEWL